MPKPPLRLDSLQVLLVHIEYDIPAIQDHVHTRLTRLDMPETPPPPRRRIPFVFQVHVGYMRHPQNGFFQLQHKTRRHQQTTKPLDQRSSLHNLRNFLPAKISPEKTPPRLNTVK